jgi:hypothetical protein
MRWFVCLLLIVASAPVSAGRDRSAEAVVVLDQFLSGTLGLNAAINRVQFLGQEAFASSQLVPVLRRAGDPRRREQVLEFLAAVAVPDVEVERVLLQALASPSTSEVISAARGLGRIRSAQAVGPLIERLAHPVPGVRREAAKALSAIGSPKAGGPLLKAARAEVDLELKLVLLRAVGRTGDRAQVAPLEAMLNESSESTRLAAAQSLCVLGAPRCAKFAAGLLTSADRSDRLQGVMLFEGAQARVASASLAPLLADSDHRVRARAARILVEGGDRSKLDWLVIESARAPGETKLAYEDELERLRLPDDERQAILKRAGLQ